MPLIIVTGLPCSGKTYRSQQIAEYISNRIEADRQLTKRSLHVVESQHASLDVPSQPSGPRSPGRRDEIYNSTAQEKTARAEEFSAAKRHVSKDTVVIADSLNYIKGYRYQLWCEAKAAGTRCCVVHVAAQEGECRTWNEERLKAWGTEDGAVESAKKASGVVGDLQPESHTAIYGDRRVKEARDGHTHTVVNGSAIKPPPDDTMTLKSLYIHDRPHPNSEATQQLSTDQTNPLQTEQPPRIPSTLLPPPTSSPPYASSTLTSLIMRYEPPSPFSRWDTPLFTIPSTDPHPPYAAIWEAIFPSPAKPTSKKALAQLRNNPSQEASDAAKKDDAVKPHAATVLPTATNANALQMLESTTLEVIRVLLSAARDQNLASPDSDGGLLTFSVPAPSATATAAAATTNPPSTPLEITIPPNTSLSQPMLQRLRRKYTQIQRGSIAHGQGYAGDRDGRRGIVQSFARFLDAELNGGE